MSESSTVDDRLSGSHNSPVSDNLILAMAMLYDFSRNDVNETFCGYYCPYLEGRKPDAQTRTACRQNKDSLRQLPVLVA